MRTRTRALLTVIVTLISVFAWMTPVSAVTLYYFRGTVRDAIARALAAATVTDGAQSTTTTADGTYALGESSTGDFTLSAFRSDTSIDTRVVNVLIPIDTTVDFTLYYLIAGTIAAPYLSTAGGSNSTTVSITSYAPSPGTGTVPGTSCVWVTDNRTGVTSGATYVSTNPNGSSLWRYTLAVPQATTEGAYNLWYQANDCSNGTRISTINTATYIIDNSPPALIDLLPGDEGNTVNFSQPLAATIRDALSGLDRSTARIDVSDPAQGTTWQPNQSSSWIGNSLRVRTDAVSLQTGSLYGGRIRVSDRAGNSLDQSWTFRHLSFDVDPTAVDIPRTAGAYRGNNKWEFLPKMNVGSFRVLAGASEHSGWGPIGQRAPLSSAVVEYRLPLVPVPLRVPAYPSDETVVIYKQFKWLMSESQPARLRAQTVLLKPITVELPPGATDAAILLDSTTGPTQTTPLVPTCVEPGPAGCTPDPLRFYLDAEFAERDSVQRVRLESHGAVVPVGDASLFLTKMVGADDNLGHWQLVVLDQGVVRVPWDEYVNPIPFAGGVNYMGSAWPELPEQFVEACSRYYPCSTSSTPTTSELREKCLRPSGRDDFRNGDPDCVQTNSFTVAAPTRSGDNTIGGFLQSRIGYADAGRDELGTAWDDGGGWQYRGDVAGEFASRSMDVYSCDGDEAFSVPPHFHVSDRYVESAQTGNITLGPYGVSDPISTQWATAAGTCFIPGTQVIETAIERSVIHNFGTTFHTARSNVQGTAVFSFGHLWNAYSYDWSLELGAQCDTDGRCSAGLGFNFRPYLETHARVMQHPVGYCFGYSNCP